MPRPSTPLPAVPDHVTQTVETVAKLHARSERAITRHQRSVEAATALLGQPRSVYAIALAIAAWVAFNFGLTATGHKSPDPPPFDWLQAMCSAGALLMATIVLTTQNRQRKLTDERAQLDLQVNLLAEQKIAKLIALLEELRRDTPGVADRVDPLAEAMTNAVDPRAVVTALQTTLDAASAQEDGALRASTPPGVRGG